MANPINQVTNANQVASKGTNAPRLPAAPGDVAQSFQQMLGDALGKVNELQLDSEQGMAQLAAGEPVDLHDVMLQAEQATMALQLMLQVRNKIIEAYQEISRMPV